MISPICDKCKKELEDYGGLLFSPPDAVDCVDKYHICKKCWDKLMEWLEEETV